MIFTIIIVILGILTASYSDYDGITTLIDYKKSKGN